MLHRQKHKSHVSISNTARVAIIPSSSWLTLLKLITVSTVLILSLTTHSVFAYPAYSHSQPLPHRSVIYFAPEEDSVVKEFLNEVLLNNCQLALKGNNWTLGPQLTITGCIDNNAGILKAAGAIHITR